MELVNDVMIAWGKGKALRFDVSFVLEDGESLFVPGFVLWKGKVIVPQRSYPTRSATKYLPTVAIGEKTLGLIAKTIQGWKDKYPEVEFP